MPNEIICSNWEKLVELLKQLSIVLWGFYKDNNIENLP